MLGWFLFAAAALTAAVCMIRLHLLRHDLRRLGADLEKRLPERTNTLLTTASGEKTVQSLTAALNRSLKALREQQIRYENGDRELKIAVTNISHDLRTPLTAITGYLELMNGSPQPPETKKQLDVIAERTKQMQSLTEELFRYSLILSEEDSAPPEEVNVSAVLEDSIAGYYAALTQRGIEPEIRTPDTPVICTCSRTALSRVFANLLNNALKYSSGDLTVTLSADGTVRFANRAPHLRPTDLEHLFDRFYTVENAQHSTGLGLAIARTAVSQMGGSITADCTDGLLCVTVTLPVHA